MRDITPPTRLLLVSTLLLVGSAGTLGCSSDDTEAAPSDESPDGGWVVSDGGSNGDADRATPEPGRDLGVVPDAGDDFDRDAPPGVGNGGRDGASTSPDSRVSDDEGRPSPGRDGGRPDTNSPDPEPDTSTGDDAGRGPGRVTERALTQEPWYGVYRVAEQPGIVGSTQELVFKSDGTAILGFQGRVTGQWEIFSQRTVRLYNLRRDGEPNRPREYTLDPVFENGYLEAFQLYNRGRGNDEVSPHLIRWRRLGGPTDISYSAITGRWQSKETFTNRQGRSFRIGLRVEQGGDIAYYIIAANATTETSRGTGRLVTYETGETMWFIEPPDTGRPQAPFAGEIKMRNGEPVLFAPRFIERDGEPGAEDFDSVELERVMRFQL